MNGMLTLLRRRLEAAGAPSSGVFDMQVASPSCQAHHLAMMAS